jgi:cation transport ATPase
LLENIHTAMAGVVAPAPDEEVRDTYTCPMHPEVVQAGPGACPKCGMALEPMEVTLETAEAVDPELGSMTRRLWIAAGLTLPLLATMFAGGMTGWLGWVEFALATPVVVWAGWPFFERGWASVVNRSPNMFTLIALGTGASYLDSVAALVLRRGDLYFESAAVITVLVLLGQVQEPDEWGTEGVAGAGSEDGDPDFRLRTRQRGGDREDQGRGPAAGEAGREDCRRWSGARRRERCR